jgi:FkbM family methyltransferase
MKNSLIQLIANWQRIKRKLRILSLEKEYESILSGQKRKYVWKNQNNVSFSDDGLTISTFKDKSYLLHVKLGDAIETKIVTHNIWDEELLNLISHFIEKNPKGTVLDIGANIGAITIPLASKYSETRFYCFEPHPVIFKKLNSNISLNQLDNVQTFKNAVSNMEVSLNFFAQTESSNMGLSSLMEVQNNSVNKISVDCIVLDQFVAKQSIDQIAIVKIDVQGSELMVLKGMTNILKKYRPILFFEHEDALHSEKGKEIKASIQKIMQENDYEMFHANSSMIKFKHYSKVDFSGVFNGNIMAIPIICKD